MFAGTKELRLNDFNTQVIVWWQSGQIWKLLPQNVEHAVAHSQSETPGLGSPPPYVRDATGQSSTQGVHGGKPR